MEPKWLTNARAEMGVHEIPGPGNNARIIGYRHDAGCDWVKGSEEAVAWCAIFVNAMLSQAGVKGTRSPAAKSFCSSHDFHPLPRAALGAITVIERNPPHPSLGHVGLLVGANRSTVWLLGGNQGDAVNVSAFARSRVKGFYWPAAVALPACGDFAYSGVAASGSSVV